MFSYLQMSDDAEVLRPLQAAGGGGAEFVRPADQQVTCGRVAAAVGANIWKLRQLCPGRTPRGCRKRDRGASENATAGLCKLKSRESALQRVWVNYRKFDLVLRLSWETFWENTV